MRPGPGKFEGCEDLEVAERLYGYALDGGVDDQFGAAGEGGWFGLIADAIVEEDDRGYFIYELFESEAAATRIFEQMAEDYYAQQEVE